MIKIRNRFSLQTIRTLKPLNNETIIFHSDIAIENMQITIRDKYKDIIYTNQLTILQSQNYSFSFNSSGEKEFTIELSYKDINLQGHFTID